MAATETSDRICEDLTICSDNGVETQAAAATSDRTCECAGEYWGDGETCSPWTLCESFGLEVGQYETLSPSITGDRECAPLTVCDYPASEYESVPAQFDSDRQCASLTVCDENTEYESAGETPTSDRACSTLTVCDYPETEYEALAPTSDTDRECALLTVCDELASVTETPTYTTDRECACNAGFYSPLGDGSTCLAWTDCENNEWMEASPTPVSDRVCTPHQVCDEST